MSSSTLVSIRLAAGLVACAVLLVSATAEAKPKPGPRGGQVELGVYGGVLRPAGDHGFYGTQWRPLAPVLGSVGVRFGHYMLKWFGGEFELGALPGRTGAGDRFRGYAARLHVVFQVPRRFAPFVLAGAGALVVHTPSRVLGSDVDLAGHAGAGLKFHATSWLAVRAEWRGSVAPGRITDSGGALVLHNEVLLGVSFLFGGPR